MIDSLQFEFGKMDEEYEWLRFKEDSPLVGSQ